MNGAGLAPELLDLPTVLDVMPLGVYDAAYHRWRTASGVLPVMRERDAVTRRLMIKTVKPAAQSADQDRGRRCRRDDRRRRAVRHDAVARSRLAAGVSGQQGLGKFDGLLG
jgi:hypothetical protein